MDKKQFKEAQKIIEAILKPKYAFQIMDSIAPVEDLLNQDMEYRAELEGSIRSYFRIFINTSQHTRSFKKYESRIREIGINLPEAIRMKIKAYFQQDSEPKDGLVDSPDISSENQD